MSKYVPQHLAARAGRIESTRMGAVALRTGRNAAALTAATTLPVGAGTLMAAPALADQAPTPSAAAKPVLAFNSVGNDVAEVQSLIALVRDGIYGPITTAAVKNFQAANGLEVDGIVGPLTWSALGQTSTVPNATLGTAGAVVELGDRGSDVRSIQKLLKMPIDGVFDRRTDAAVRNFQAANGLEADGVVGPKTATALANRVISEAKAKAAAEAAAKTKAAVGTKATVDGTTVSDAAKSAASSTITPAPATPTAPATPQPAASVATAPSGIVSPNAMYELPFPAGAGYIISQGPFGSASHYKYNDKHHVDFATPVGSTIVSSADGTVYKTEYNRYGGNTLLIKDASGYCMEYAHMDSISVVPGQRVAQGQRVGASGATGERITGPHLHWGIVDCSSYTSIRIADTKELGTTYVPGMIAVSRNGA